MAEYTAHCNSGVGDTITATMTSSSVELEAYFGSDYAGEVYLTPTKARTFARGILALADEIDGGEVAEAAPKREIQVGDTIRVLTDGAQGAGVYAGETYIVREVTDEPDDRDYNGPIKVDGKGANGQWHLSRKSVELVDEVPAPEPALADWERDLLEGSAPTRSPRAKYVEEARELLGDTYFDADNLTKLAEFLAGE